MVKDIEYYKKENEKLKSDVELLTKTLVYVRGQAANNVLVKDGLEKILTVLILKEGGKVTINNLDLINLPPEITLNSSTDQESKTMTIWATED